MKDKFIVIEKQPGIYYLHSVPIRGYPSKHQGLTKIYKKLESLIKNELEFVKIEDQNYQKVCDYIDEEATKAMAQIKKKLSKNLTDKV